MHLRKTLLQKGCFKRTFLHTHPPQKGRGDQRSRPCVAHELRVRMYALCIQTSEMSTHLRLFGRSECANRSYPQAKIEFQPRSEQSDSCTAILQRCTMPHCTLKHVRAHNIRPTKFACSHEEESARMESKLNNGANYILIRTTVRTIN